MILGNFYALGVTMFNKYSSCRNINNLTFFVYHCLKDVVLLVLFSFIPLLSSLGKTPMKKELSETRRYRRCAGNQRGLMLKCQQQKMRGGHLGFLAAILD